MFKLSFKFQFSYSECLFTKDIVESIILWAWKFVDRWIVFR